MIGNVTSLIINPNRVILLRSHEEMETILDGEARSILSTSSRSSIFSCSVQLNLIFYFDAEAVVADELGEVYNAARRRAWNVALFVIEY